MAKQKVKVNNEWKDLGGGGGGGLPVTGQTTSYAALDDGAVQAGLPRNFTDNGDGTIIDHVTNLMWKKDTETGGDPLLLLTWANALAKTSNTAGYTDWRLPNLNELLSLVRHEGTGFLIDTTLFNNVTTESFWSSTSAVRFTPANNAYQVSFYPGGASSLISYLNKNNARDVRLVRSIT